MSASVEPCPLIIGIGNPLRSDDGLGWAVAEHLKNAMGKACDIVTAYQLTPELACQVAGARLVIVIDASFAGQSGELHAHHIKPDMHSITLATHLCTPEILAVITKALYGACPPLYTVTVTGANFEMGEHLSPIVALQIPGAITLVQRLCALPARTL